MLINAADMLKKAEAGKYGLGAFNTNNLEWTLAILQAAEEAKVSADPSVHRWCR